MSGTNTVLGGGSDTFFGGTAGADTVTGSAVADSILGAASGDSLYGMAGNDTIDGGAGNDTIDGGTGANSILGGTGNDSIIAHSGDTIIGGDGNDTITGTADGIRAGGSAGDDFISIHGSDNTLLGGADTSNAAAGADTIASYGDRNAIIGNAQSQAFTLAGSNNTLTGLNGNDSLYFDGTAGGGNSLDGGNGGGDILNIAGGYTVTGTSGGSTIISTSGGAQTISGWENVVVCFAEGTDILTAHGEVRVEKLQAGGLVATVSGQGAPMKPVLWVGRRKVKLTGNPNAELLTPIRIKAGALGDCTPHRDLLVSPDHCMYLDGALVPARLLVNGTTIVAERGLAEVTYYHIELENHDVLLAQGAAAESWIDANNRDWFENAPVARMQVTGSLDLYGEADATRLCAPIVQGGEKLGAIRDAIAVRSATAPQAQPAAPARDIAAA